MSNQSVNIDNLTKVFSTIDRYQKQLQAKYSFPITNSQVISIPKWLVGSILIILGNIRQTLAMYNFLNINHQAGPRLRRHLSKRISKIEQRDNIRFIDKSLVQRSLKKTSFLREKRDKISAIPLALL